MPRPVPGEGKRRESLLRLSPTLCPGPERRATLGAGGEPRQREPPVAAAAVSSVGGRRRHPFLGHPPPVPALSHAAPGPAWNKTPPGILCLALTVRMVPDKGRGRRQRQDSDGYAGGGERGGVPTAALNSWGSCLALTVTTASACAIRANTDGARAVWVARTPLPLPFHNLFFFLLALLSLFRFSPSPFLFSAEARVTSLPQSRIAG